MTIDRPERETQDRIVALFKNELGYCYLGDRKDFANSNIWEEHLASFLTRSGYSEAHISRAVEILNRTANSSGGLYERNQEVYKLLRYGVDVKAGTGKFPKKEVKFLINSQNGIK
jgi:type I restriction enzyme R subunit